MMGRKCLEIDAMRLAAKLTRWMERRGLSDQDVSRSLKEAGAGVSDSTVRRWRLGSITPRLEELEGLARVMEVPILYLADSSLDDLPRPAVSPDEMVAVELFRQMGLEGFMAMVAREMGKTPQIPGPDRPAEGKGRGASNPGNGMGFNLRSN